MRKFSKSKVSIVLAYPCSNYCEVLHGFVAFATTIFLKSTHEGNPLCFGDREVFQCTVTGPGVLLWVIESLKTFATDGIIFSVADEPGVVPDNYPEVFRSLLSV